MLKTTYTSLQPHYRASLFLTFNKKLITQKKERPHFQISPRASGISGLGLVTSISHVKIRSSDILLTMIPSFQHSFVLQHLRHCLLPQLVLLCFGGILNDMFGVCRGNEQNRGGIRGPAQATSWWGNWIGTLCAEIQETSQYLPQACSYPSCSQDIVNWMSQEHPKICVYQYISILNASEGLLCSGHFTSFHGPLPHMYTFRAYWMLYKFWVYYL